jgi:hypothetical protein
MAARTLLLPQCGFGPGSPRSNSAPLMRGFFMPRDGRYVAGAWMRRSDACPGTGGLLYHIPVIATLVYPCTAYVAGAWMRRSDACPGMDGLLYHIPVIATLVYPCTAYVAGACSAKSQSYFLSVTDFHVEGR